MSLRLALCAAFAVILPATVSAQALPEGYLCCNMRTTGTWISDINYVESGTRMIPAGTPIKATGYGRFRVMVNVDGKADTLGNDYSRDLDQVAFAQRYIVAEDPRAKLAGFEPRVREAVTTAKVLLGMTREQVLMSQGYPVSSENPNLKDKTWRYWLDSFSEFQVVFDASGRVKDIVASPTVRARVIAE